MNNNNIAVFIVYTIAIFVIGFLMYSVFNRPQKIQISQVMNELPPQIETHHWGYNWRPYWRKYGGVPGLGKPLPKPGKHIIIPNTP